MAEKFEIVITGNSKAAQEALRKAGIKIDDVSKKTKKGGLSLGQLKLAWIAAAAAIAKAVQIVGKWVRLAAEQEKQERLLAAAMQQAGTFTAAALQHNLDYAASLQQMTTYGDEAILGVQRMLANFGVEGEMMDKLTEQTLNLASAKGMDLKAAGDLVAKSVGSSTNALTRYGIEVKGAVGSTERMQTAVENISKIFGGAAQAEAETFSGRVAQMNNALGDTGEKIGDLLIPLLKPLVKLITDVAVAFGDVLVQVLEFATNIATPIQLFIEQIKFMRATIDAVLANLFSPDKREEELERIRKVHEATMKAILKETKKTEDDKNKIVEKGFQKQIAIYIKGLDDVKTVFNDVTLLIKESSEIVVDSIMDGFKDMEFSTKAIFASIAGAFISLFSAELAAMAAKELAKAIAMTIVLNPKAALHYVAAAGLTAAAGTLKATKGAVVSSLTSAAQGADFMTSGPQAIVVGDNPSGIEHVQVTPSEQNNDYGITIQNLIVQANSPEELERKLQERYLNTGSRQYSR